MTGEPFKTALSLDNDLCAIYKTSFPGDGDYENYLQKVAEAINQVDAPIVEGYTEPNLHGPGSFLFVRFTVKTISIAHIVAKELLGVN